MGDTIMFRGKPRFVVLLSCGGLALEGVRGGNVVYYQVGKPERLVCKIVRASSVRSRARARKLYEGTCLPHTRIEWSGDIPTYVHTVKGVEYRHEPRVRSSR